ncbi:MAG: hypothetical protein AAFY31_13285, partial [Pseudomonadota bacterium]
KAKYCGERYQVQSFHRFSPVVNIVHLLATQNANSNRKLNVVHDGMEFPTTSTRVVVAAHILHPFTTIDHGERYGECCCFRLGRDGIRHRAINLARKA